MVEEQVVCRLVGNPPELALTQIEITAVCDRCVTVSEQAAASTNTSCKNCGQPMRLNPRLQANTCSSRCHQGEPVIS
jgi:hypothetical protein